jgi:glycosyltransferase involved in cell wall biosynthesis
MILPVAKQNPAMNAPLSVAMMCESDALGGAEMVILRLAESLSRRGHRIIGVGPDEATQPNRGSNGWLRGKFADAGFEWRTYRKRRPVDPLCVRQLADILREARVDVVHSHEFAMAVYGTAATRLAHLRHVISMHGNAKEGAKWKARVALRWAFARSQAIAVSEMTRVHLEEVLALPPGRVQVIQNGVPEREGDRRRGRGVIGAGDDEIVVLAVGTLIPRKNHELLLRALAALGVEDIPSWRLAVAGNGGEQPRLEALVEELGLGGRVKFLGPRDDVDDLLAASDIFAMPSNWEGLPLAMLEAMFAGKPIIASEVGGIPEAINNGVEGLLFPPQDKDKLADALRALLTNPGRRAQLGQAARERAQRDFSIESMTDAYEKQYVANG